MTREEFKNGTFEELMIKLDCERDDITTYERLKEFAIDRVNNDDLLVAIHILEALHEDTAEWYQYDYPMGTLDTPCGLTVKDNIKLMIRN